MRDFEFFTLALPHSSVIRDGQKPTFDFGGHVSPTIDLTPDGATVAGDAETSAGDPTEHAFIWRAGDANGTLLPKGLASRPNRPSNIVIRRPDTA